MPNGLLLGDDGMTEKRFIITQNGDNFTVRDNLKKRHMGMFEFKQDEFPVYFCFHKIIDLLNEQHEEIQHLQRHLDVMRSGALTDDKRIKELYEENEQLKEENKILLSLITEILDYIEDNNSVSLDEMKQFWKSKEKELR